MLALQRLAGNRATQVALGRASAQALQRLVLTTEEPPKPTDSPLDIANKYEVERAANALAGAEKPSYIMDWRPDLDANKVNYVVGHSGGEKLGGFTVDELADLLFDRGMKDGMVVRLVACKTGVGDGQLPMAARLAIALNDTYRLNNLAVKGARGILVKTRRKTKGETKDGPDGVTGVYQASGLPQFRADLGRLQSALFDKLATHLHTLITTLDENGYRTINSEVLAIFDVFDAGADARNLTVFGANGEAGREGIATLLGKMLRKKFSNRILLTNTEAYFTPVMDQIRAIAAKDAGQTSLAAEGGSKSFAVLVSELTETFFADSKKAVEDWFAAIPTSETAKKLPRGNIAYRIGTPNPELFPKSYSETAVPLEPVEAEPLPEPEQ